MSVLSEIKTRLKDYDDSIEELEEMDLSEIKMDKLTPEIVTHLNKYKNVKAIILNNCGLTSIENLPKWDLIVIDVSENK